MLIASFASSIRNIANLQESDSIGWPEMVGSKFGSPALAPKRAGPDLAEQQNACRIKNKQSK
jgi:hypothetical protein